MPCSVSMSFVAHFCQPYRARELKELKCLCTDDEKTMMSWMMAVRIAKVGIIILLEMLRANCQVVIVL